MYTSHSHEQRCNFKTHCIKKVDPLNKFTKLRKKDRKKKGQQNKLQTLAIIIISCQP
ncbi:hypothetical protein LguiB_008696 [Lonicera macranthoides]